MSGTAPVYVICHLYGYWREKEDEKQQKEVKAWKGNNSITIKTISVGLRASKGFIQARTTSNSEDLGAQSPDGCAHRSLATLLPAFPGASWPKKSQHPPWHGNFLSGELWWLMCVSWVTSFSVNLTSKNISNLVLQKYWNTVVRCSCIIQNQLPLPSASAMSAALAKDCDRVAFFWTSHV